MILRNNITFLPQIFPDKPPIIPQECPISTYSAHSDPDCFPNTVAQPYPHLSKVFGHPLIDKALKLYSFLNLKHYSYSEFLFLTVQSVALIPGKKQSRHVAK